ncbi:MAG: sigma-70 family RNA polymerase sigma factor [Deltaproteobacteria bacterium]|nr:sigma-70 family RNA polymerase sigma factor [Deltaproteobacteria bacterium]
MDATTDGLDDRDALVLAVVRGIPRLRRQAFGLCRDPSEAEDLVQETLVKALQNLDQFRSGSEPGPWLARILRNTFFNIRRKARTGVRLLEDFRYMEELRDPPEARRPDSFLVERILEALGGIPPDFRRCIELCDLSDLSYREAASRLGIPIGTVMSRLHRGRRLLGRLLSPVRLSAASNF